MNKLADKVFKNIIENAPLFSIGIVVMNSKYEILFGERLNAPANKLWFVPGGRVYKNEPQSKAFNRITNSELSIKYNLEDAKFIGLYDHLYKESFFSPEISTHYINASYLIKISSELFRKTLPLDQHSKYKWIYIEEISSNSKIHENSKLFINDLVRILND